MAPIRRIRKKLVNPFVISRGPNSFCYLTILEAEPSVPVTFEYLAVLNQRALFVRNDAVLGADHKLAATCCAPMIVFTAVNMAVCLGLCRSTPWTDISDNHGCCWPPSRRWR